MGMRLEMRLARACEVDQIMGVLQEGRAAIARLGISQWTDGYPSTEVILDDIAHGACYVAERADAAEAALGTLALRRERDADYSQARIGWLTRDAGERTGAGEPPYGAIHRCATAAAATQRGVMGFMFASAEEICRREGRASIRVDTHPRNTVMRAFLEKRGFTACGAFELVSHGAGADRTRVGYERLLRA